MLTYTNTTSPSMYSTTSTTGTGSYNPFGSYVKITTPATDITGTVKITTPTISTTRTIDPDIFSRQDKISELIQAITDVYNKAKLQKEKEYKNSDMSIFTLLYQIHPVNSITIVERVPEKVYDFYFNDKFNCAPVKMVRCEGDEHDLRYACAFAIAKYMFKDVLTFDGIYCLSFWIQNIKCFDKLITKAIKQFEKSKKLEAEEKEEEERRKRQHKHYIEKKKAYKARKKNELVDIVSKGVQKANTISRG